MKRTMTMVVLLTACAVLAIAGGTQEKVTATGTVIGFDSAGPDSFVVTIETAESETYTITVDSATAESLGIELGTELTVEGEVDDDGMEIEIERVSSGDREYEPQDAEEEDSEDDDDDEDDEDEDDDDDDDEDDENDDEDEEDEEDEDDEDDS